MIATDLNLTVEGVRQITKRLAAAGWLAVEWLNGPGRGEEHHKQYVVKHPQKTPPAIPVLSNENPNGGGDITTENPNRQTGKTPTAKLRYKEEHIHEHIQGGCGGDSLFKGSHQPPPWDTPVAKQKNKANRQKALPSAKKKPPVAYPPDFERFWGEYPKKAGKLEAFKEWQALDPDDALVERIILAVRAWKRSKRWTKNGGEYIKDPCRFLKYRWFDDELPCSPEPQRGDPDWLPTLEEVEATRRACDRMGAMS